MNDNKSHNIAAVAIAMLLVGGLVGFGIASAMDDDTSSANTSEMAPSTTTDAANLRATLQEALTEHVDLAAPALKSAATGADDTDAALAALDANSVEIAEAVNSVYDGTRDDFLALWQGHIGFFADYTNAVVAGDEDAQEQALADLNGYQDQASTFFSDANPNLDKDTLQSGLETHTNQVITIIDSFAAGDHDAAYEAQRKATDHMAGFAGTLANAIVLQFPDQF